MDVQIVKWRVYSSTRPVHLSSPLFCPVLSCPVLSSPSLLPFTLFCPLLSSVPPYSTISYSAISSQFQFRYVLRYDMVCYIDPLKGRPREQPAFNIQQRLCSYSYPPSSYTTSTLSIHPSLYPSTHPSIHSSINLSITVSISSLLLYSITSYLPSTFPPPTTLPLHLLQSFI